MRATRQRTTWATAAVAAAAAIGLGGCGGARFPNSGWGQDGRRTCEDDCPGAVSWIRRMGGPTADAARTIGLLGNDRFLVTGFSQGPATTGVGAEQASSLDSACYRGAFVARVRTEGDIEWTACASQADGYGLAVLPDGGAYVVGDYEGTALFGLGEETEATFTATASFDLFLARYDPDGRLSWAREVGGDGRMHGAAVAALPDGSAVLTGSFAGTTVFGRGTASEIEVTSPTRNGIFVARYDADGVPAWVRSFGARPADEGTAIGVDPGGGIVVAGHVGMGVAFDAFTPAVEGETDAFLARFTPEGDVDRAWRIGGPGDDSADGLAVLPDGGLLVTGHYEAGATFDAGGEGEPRRAAAGHTDAFVARYDAGGALLWVASAGGPGPDAGFAVAADPEGGAVVAGAFEGTAVFGAGETNETRLTAVGDADAFVARYDRDGRLLWAVMAGGPGHDAVRGLAVTPGGEIVLAGSYGPQAVFGAGESGETTMTSIEDPEFSVEPCTVSDAFLGVLRP